MLMRPSDTQVTTLAPGPGWGGGGMDPGIEEWEAEVLRILMTPDSAAVTRRLLTVIIPDEMLLRA